MISPYLKTRMQRTWRCKIDYWVSHPDERADYSRKYLDSGTQFEQQSCMRQMEQMLFDAAAMAGAPV